MSDPVRPDAPAPAEAPGPAVGQDPAPGQAVPAAAPAARPGGTAIGLAAAVLAALVTAAVYGAIIGGTGYQVGFVALGVGFGVGYAGGRLGGGSPLVDLLCGVLALGAIYAGQLFGVALLAADQLEISTADVLSLGVSPLHEAWLEAAGPLTYVFLLIGAYTAFKTARKHGAGA